MLTVREILKATSGKRLSGEKDLKFNNLSTDTRTLAEGSLFVPLIGKRYDGHNFISEAFQKGALGALTAKPTSEEIPPGKVVIKVKDTLKAFQQIAYFHRKRFKIPVIGITGSSGKTTTKDMIASILSEVEPTLKTNENYNNEIGVPLTLIKLNSSHKAAVIEMAMQKKEEIKELAKIALPSIAVITNIGEAHLQKLKSKKEVAAAKAKLLHHLDRGGFAILPADDKFYAFLKNQAKGSKIFSFGIQNRANFWASDIKGDSHGVSFILHAQTQAYRIILPIPGRHNVYNALAAAAVANLLKIKKRAIIEGLKKFKPSSKRMEIFVRSDEIRVINDTYNANPSSMKAALEVLREQGPVVGTTPPRRIAVLGDMLELGQHAISAHRQIGRVAAKSADLLITVGRLSDCIGKEAKKEGLKVFTYRSKKTAIKRLKSLIKPNDVILIKGSRGMQLEKIVGALCLVSTPAFH